MWNIVTDCDYASLRPKTMRKDIVRIENFMAAIKRLFKFEDIVSFFSLNVETGSLNIKEVYQLIAAITRLKFLNL